MDKTANNCKECGCSCRRCINVDQDVQLHVEIENLKQRLLEKENHIVSMETNFLNEANKFPSGEIIALREELITWQDKYKRLYDAHRRVQKVNQGLEDKLLKVVDNCETEKNALTKDVAVLSQNLAEANYAIKKLTDDNERYKSDVNLAIQFLQCKQTNYVAHKFDALPQEVQNQVSVHMTGKRKPEEAKTPPSVRNIKVPIPTFPPTAMVYSVPKSPKPDLRTEEEKDVEQAEVDIVSAAIMAKVLEERQKERAMVKHCDTCTCAKNFKIVHEVGTHDVGTQTGHYKENVCLKCNESVITAPTTGVSIVRNSTTATKVPIYPANDNADIAPATCNIVKVQPNNFLINKTKNSSTTSSQYLIDLDSPIATRKTTEHTEPTPNVIEVQVNEKLQEPKLEHHKLCNKSTASYEFDNSTSNHAPLLKPVDNLKGPRYCSMLVQSGSKNILLDNAHNNVPPVLYTRSHKLKKEAAPQAYPKFHQIETDSVVSSTESKLISLSTDNSQQNHQRVAAWVQNNLDNDNVSSSDNSFADSLNADKINVIDKARYAEMEENVKKFLFGESEFLKTVEIGKLKYESLRNKTESCESKSDENKNGSYTETVI